MKMKIQAYPEKESNGQYVSPARPSWCPGCKIQINPGDPCALPQGNFICFWTCTKPGCYEFVNALLHVPFTGIKFRDALYQHARFLDHQKNRAYKDGVYFTWAEWCADQGESLGLDGVYSYSDQWLKFPEPFLENQNQ